MASALKSSMKMARCHSRDHAACQALSRIAKPWLRPSAFHALMRGMPRSRVTCRQGIGDIGVVLGYRRRAVIADDRDLPRTSLPLCNACDHRALTAFATRRITAAISSADAMRHCSISILDISCHNSRRARIKQLILADGTPKILSRKCRRQRRLTCAGHRHAGFITRKSSRL